MENKNTAEQALVLSGLSSCQVASRHRGSKGESQMRANVVRLKSNAVRLKCRTTFDPEISEEDARQADGMSANAEYLFVFGILFIFGNIVVLLMLALYGLSMVVRWP